jgi:hypothetical protein
MMEDLKEKGRIDQWAPRALKTKVEDKKLNNHTLRCHT